MTLTIPPQIHMDGLLPFLARLSTVGDAEEICLDFSGLRRVSPGALVALVATVTRWLLVVSGSGVVRMNPGGNAEILPFPEAGRYDGTLVVTAFRQKSAIDFAGLLHDAKLQSGLLRAGVQGGRFQP